MGEIWCVQVYVEWFVGVIGYQVVVEFVFGCFDCSVGFVGGDVVVFIEQFEVMDQCFYVVFYVFVVGWCDFEVFDYDWVGVGMQLLYVLFDDVVGFVYFGYVDQVVVVVVVFFVQWNVEFDGIVFGVWLFFVQILGNV